MSTLSDSQIETVERYLLNRLSDDDRTEFEVSFLENPELFDEVQRQQALISALKSEEISSVIKFPAKNVLTLAQWVQQPFSIAASFFLAISLSIILTSNPQSDFSNSVATNLLIETTRGPASSIESSGVAPMLLTVDVGPDDGSSRFSITFVDRSNDASVLSLSNLKVDDQGWLRIFVNESFSGEHAISIGKIEDGASVIIKSQQVNFLP